MTPNCPMLPENLNSVTDKEEESPSLNELPVPEPKKKIIPNIPNHIALIAFIFVVMFDYFLYRGSGGLGYALFIPLAALLLYSAHKQASKSIFSLPLVLILILIAKTLWQYDSFTPWLGFFTLAALAFNLAELPACILDKAKSCLASALCSPIIEVGFLRSLTQLRLLRLLRTIDGWPILVPLLVVGVFLTIFGLGNPIVASWLSAAGDWLSGIVNNFTDWLPSGWEILFWIVSGLITAIWLCPFKDEAKRLKNLLGPTEELAEEYYTDEKVDRYSLMAQNTLIAVNLLFLIYNGVDASYLWIQKSLPEGISYSEYAINGTIWLTVALALTSMVLGVIFSGHLNFHARTLRLRAFAWIWAVQNLLLALFAYHRLLIYITFNGLTRWRMVGAFGITLVILGLLIVVRKIQKKKSFLWMVRRQLTAFMLALFILLVFPMDYIAHTVNTRQILAGKIGPAYQVVSQPKSAEGLPPLIPLLDTKDITIRDGAAGVLLKELESLRTYNRTHSRWTYVEFSRNWAVEKLIKIEPRLRELIPDGNWQERIDALYVYTKDYKWPGRPDEQDY